MHEYSALGLMSGTSLDGLDICFAEFSHQKAWIYRIICAETITYPDELAHALRVAHTLSAEQLVELHYSYGQWLGKQCQKFIAKNGIKPQLIASHGHTVFHNPKRGYTLQIGKGAAIAAITGIPCIADFRSTDICLGGQGAPLVPIGDRLLFGNYQLCLNLGGIANISFDSTDGNRTAFDICPCNMALNYLANKAGKPYDLNGQMGREGSINPELLRALNELDYYRQPSPKSLGREWFQAKAEPLIEKHITELNHSIRTIYEHIAIQISEVTSSFSDSRMLLTGGGAHNKFLVELIDEKTSCKLVVPDSNTIDYKEALIFAFLGILRTIKQNGALASATGASRDSITGACYW